MGSDYFFDSCILIGSRLPWDVQYKVACACVDNEQIKKRTSDRVYWECSHKFEEVRYVIWTFYKQNLKKLKSNAWNFDSHIDRCKRDFLKSNFSTKEKQEDAEDILKPFLDKYRYNIRDSILSGDEVLCCNLVEDVVNNAINSLDEDCLEPNAKIEKHMVTDEDIEQYSDKRDKLETKISNRSDISILLDSYHIKQTILVHKTICFVTTDKKDISDKSGDIEGILTGVYIRNPHENPL
jgi:hypothetical protein